MMQVELETVFLDLKLHGNIELRRLLRERNR